MQPREVQDRVQISLPKYRYHMDRKTIVVYLPQKSISLYEMRKIYYISFHQCWGSGSGRIRKLLSDPDPVNLSW
jgi:hypothetical protein